MSNAADLLSILNGAQMRRPPAASSTSGATESSILSIKAGKMNAALQPNGKFLVEPDARRGELHVVWIKASGGGGGAHASAAAANGRLVLQWQDRRTKAVVNSIPVFPEDDAAYERVETGRDGDRVYLLTVGENRHFFWMQDKNSEFDEDFMIKANLYAGDYSEASSAASGEEADAAASSGADPADDDDGMDNADLLRLMQGALGDDEEGGRTTTVPGAGSVPTGRAAELGNILQGLNLPPASGGSSAAAPIGAASSSGGGGGLTLADLQGAMAGLATASPGTAGAAPGPPLAELAAADVVEESGILNDPAAVERLLALLPETQRTEDQLRENLRSPQVAQCLQRLTATLSEDAAGFNSIVANFQLDPSDGTAAQLAGNPVEAFLQCLLKDVERREGVKKADEESKDESGGGDESQDNDGGDEKDGSSGDGGTAAMDES